MAEIDVLVSGGEIVSYGWSGRADIAIRDGVITEVLDPGANSPSAAREVDASDLLVLPGGVDPHVHVGIEFGGFETADDHESATLAALFGGTTTIVDFAIPSREQTPLEAATARRQMAKGTVADMAFHGCVVGWDDSVPNQLADLADTGIRTIKMFTTYRDIVMAEPDTIRRVMEILNRLDGLVYVHAESNHLVEASQERLADAGTLDVAYHPQSRPEIAEDDAVRAVLGVAELVNAPVYFVHQTTRSAIELTSTARQRGVRAFSETCPHYILLDDSIYSREGGEAFVCCPPVRSRSVAQALMDGVLTGMVDTLGSDHCCFQMGQKQASRGDIRSMPFGMPGVETRMPILFSELVVGRGLPIEEFVRMTASAPAQLNGLFPRKGVIAPGADGDLVLWDRSARWVVDAAELHQATDYSPYDGWEVTGRPVIVIAGGEIVIEDGKEVSRHQGRILNAGPISVRALDKG